MRGLSGTPPQQKSLERKKGFGDQREEVGFREKVSLVPVVGKAAEIERAVIPLSLLWISSRE